MTFRCAAVSNSDLNLAAAIWWCYPQQMETHVKANGKGKVVPVHGMQAYIADAEFISTHS
jgi:hypothetical protein